MAPRFDVLNGTQVLVAAADKGVGALIDSFAPEFVLLLEPSVEVVRRLELYQAERRGTGRRLRVYFFVYADSVEQQRYVTTLRTEGRAFRELLAAKSSIVLEQDEHGNVPVPGRKRAITCEGGAAPPASTSFSAGASSRVGGLKVPTATPSVIVDVREFRSELPSCLHEAGVDIHPCTLAVADYVLSPTMAVERKSVATGDLKSSFESGRLYKQIEQMCRHYVTVILLIEFSPRESFSLTPRHEIGTEMRQAALSSKLTLLCKHFPRLRLIWSRGPQHTTQIFLALKHGDVEPNTATAVAIGGAAASDGDAAAAEDDFSMTPYDLLRSMPGVRDSNLRALLARCNSVAALCDIECDELVKMLGKADGTKLFDFLHVDKRHLF
jgi:DNA excision repair protein ERCC-4